jgi:RNA polymerase sigma-70 factor (ECF subfamily)
VHLTHSSLLVQLRDGSSSPAWEEFVVTYQPLIQQTLRATGIATSDLDDAVQDVLLKLLHVLPTFAYQRQRGFFRHWLKRVTRNTARDRQRRRQLPTLPADFVEDIPATEQRWDSEFERALLQTAVRQIQAEFRPRTWKCFEHHLIQGATAQTTALQVGVSVNAVYVNCSRVTARLREFCEFYGEEMTDEPPLHLADPISSTCLPDREECLPITQDSEIRCPPGLSAGNRSGA